MIKSRFSILSACSTGIKMLYENALFYIAWVLVAGLFNTIYFLGTCVYVHLINGTYVLNDVVFLIQEPIQFLQQPVGSFYGVLETIFPSDWLNHALESMSWSEYYHIIVYPRIVPLCIILAIGMFCYMSMVIGYIKTALAVQEQKAIFFHDLYRHYYLVPYFFVTKLLGFIAAFLPMIIWCIALALGKIVASNIPSALAVLAMAVSLFFATMYSVWIYQRLRLASLFVIDQHMSPMQACIASWHTTQGAVLHLMLFGLLSLIVLKACLVSGLLGIIIMMLYRQINVSVYRQLVLSK